MEDKDGSPDIPPSDEKGEDEAIDDVGVDDVEHGQGSFDQGKPSLRRSAWAPVPSTRYPLSDYVQVAKSHEHETFGKVKAHANWVNWMRDICKMRRNSFMTITFMSLLHFQRGREH